MRRTLDAAPVFAHEFDREGRILWHTQHVDRTNGLRLAEVRGMKMTDVWPGDEAFDRAQFAVLKGGKPVKYIAPTATKLGAPLWCDFTVRRTRRGVFVVAVDVTAAILLARVRVITAPHYDG